MDPSTAIESLYRSACLLDFQDFIDRLIGENGCVAARVTWQTALSSSRFTWEAGETARIDPLAVLVQLEAAEEGSELRLFVHPGEGAEQTQGLLSPLQPHFPAVVRLLPVTLEKARALHYKALLGAHGWPAMIVDRDLRVIHANTAAQGLVSRCVPPLLGPSGCLAFGTEDRETGQRVRDLVSACRAGPHVGIALRRDGARQVRDIIAVRPCPTFELDGEASTAMLVWVPLETIRPLSEDALRAIMSLTPAESALANALAAGVSTAKHARDTNTSAATLRWHLHNAKTHSGTASAGELARLTLLLQIFARGSVTSA